MHTDVALLFQEAVLVLEDDMELLRWPTNELLAMAPEDWQVLQLYSLGPRASHLYTLDDAPLWDAWNLSKHLFNTGAYVINRSGMRQVLSDEHRQCVPTAAYCCLPRLSKCQDVTDTCLQGCIMRPSRVQQQGEAA